jgi:hypothetical protein
MKTLSSVLLLFLATAAPSFATVIVSSPSNGATVSLTVSYAATASTSTCSTGVASMGVYVDDELLYTVSGNVLKTTLTINPGNHTTVVEEWDFCGGATFVSMSITATAAAGVHVTSPANNSTVSSPVSFVATATSTCAKGVASVGIYVDNQLVYVEQGAALNTPLSLAAGAQQTVVEEWDKCGGASYVLVNLTVQSDEHVLSGLQSSEGWNGWGELPPVYNICSAPCSGVKWSMSQHTSSPSLSGNASAFSLSGTVPYADVLWSIPLIGQNSMLGIPDSGHTLLPTLHNFTYDAYFYGSNLSLTQVIEFDINMYMNGLGLLWGTQCRIAGGNEWDTWDDTTAQWAPTGIPCDPVSNEWNHVTIQAQRQSDNTLLYESISLNGVTTSLNKTTPPFSVPAGWWGITANYQMDGNYKQSSNTTYLDNFSFTYW